MPQLAHSSLLCLTSTASYCLSTTMETAHGHAAAEMLGFEAQGKLCYSDVF